MLYLGIDGGGTKTEAVLTTSEGHLLSRCVLGPSAPSSVALPQLTQTLSQLVEEMELPLRGQVSAYAGISGCAVAWDREMVENVFARLLPANVSMRVGSDSVCALNAAIGPGADGVLLIAGTGSVAYLRRGEQYTRIGGWGWMIGDEGSGYDMGRRVISSVLRAFDGRGPKTLLQKLVEQRTGAAADQVGSSIYAKGRTEMASYAPLLIAAAEAGDTVAVMQMNECIEELRLHAVTAIRMADGASLPVVVAGGIVTGSPYVQSALRRALGNIPLVLPKAAPVYGAVLEAAGEETEEFAKNFLEEYKS